MLLTEVTYYGLSITSESTFSKASMVYLNKKISTVILFSSRADIMPMLPQNGGL